MTTNRTFREAISNLPQAELEAWAEKWGFPLDESTTSQAFRDWCNKHREELIKGDSAPVIAELEALNKAAKGE